MATARKTGWMAAGLLTGAMLLLPGCKSEPAQPSLAGRTEPLMIVSRTHGSDPAFKQPGVFIFNSRDELAKAGAQTLNPDVDFATHSLVVLALGQEPTAGYWVRIIGVQHFDQTLYVQGVANQPAKAAMAAMMITYPFDAVVVPKTTATAMHPEVESVTGRPEPAK